MIGKFLTLLRKIEGRDKVTKFLIYLFKLIDAVKTLWRGHPTYRYERIGMHFQRARQFMRLGKFITQNSEIINLIKQDTSDEFGRLIRIIIHVFFSLYWILDNLSLMATFDFIDFPSFQLLKKAMSVKFVALILAGFFNLRTWLRLHHAELKARKALKYLKDEDNLKKNEELMELIRKQWIMFLMCLKIVAEMLPSLGKSDISKKMLHIELPRIVQALGGLLNALVSCLITFL